MGRVLIVSNRLPISVARDAAGVLRVNPSSGGLATGLSGVHTSSGGLWIGWPGISGPLQPQEEAALSARYAELAVVPVPLSEDEVERYYEQFCNGILWPALHYLISDLPLQIKGYDLYEAVNRRFADAVVAHYRPGRHHLDTRLSVDAGAADDPRAAARRTHRILPAHPVSRFRRVSYPAVPGGVADRPAGRGPGRLSHGGVHAALRLVGAAHAGRGQRRGSAALGRAQRAHRRVPDGRGRGRLRRPCGVQRRRRPPDGRPQP